jgi:mannose-6-phosphate isomerase-like protein (cupin superfamily)
MTVFEAIQPVVRLGEEGERTGFGSAELIFKSPLPGTDQGWSAADTILPAGQMGAPLHYHRELTESFFVISGSLWMRVGDTEFVAEPGSYALVPPGTLHSFANRSDAPARFLLHASSPRHKEYLCKLFRMAEADHAWPPTDPAKVMELSSRYDTFFV